MVRFDPLNNQADSTGAQPDFITIVSGYPRSGTSLMMQILEAGGMPVLIDDTKNLTNTIQEVITNAPAP